MLSVLDRRLRAWHFWLVNGVAVAWFVGMSSPRQAALPGVKLFRCPIGLCLGYYSPIELTRDADRIGRNGREFLAETLLPLDMVLPALLLVALRVTYVWFSRPAETVRAAEPGRPLRVPVRAAASIAWRTMPRTGRLVEALQAYPNIPYRLARRASFLTAAKSQLIVGVGRHCRGARHRRLGPGARWRDGSRGDRRRSRAGNGLRLAGGVDQAPFSTSANTLRAARKHSTPSGTPA